MKNKINFYVYIGEQNYKVDFDLMCDYDINQVCKNLNVKSFMLESIKTSDEENQTLIQSSLFEIYPKKSDLTTLDAVESYIDENYEKMSEITRFHVDYFLDKYSIKDNDIKKLYNINRNNI